MDLKILMLILGYWGLFLAMFVLSEGLLLNEGYSIHAELNSTELASSEVDTGGLFGTGVSLGRFVAFTLFGVGLPSDTPFWISVPVAIWQTMFTIFTVGFVISGIWNG